MFGWLTSIFSWLVKTSIFSWLVNLWWNVPDPVKEKIINMIVETFESMFREFWRSKKKDQEAASE